MARGGTVYIMTNNYHTTLYVGVTPDLQGHVGKHKEKFDPGNFNGRYNLHKLVYYERFSRMEAAMDREKQIKARPRQKKIDLIKLFNPKWDDLFELEVKFWQARDSAKETALLK